MKKSLLLSILSAILLILSFPNYNLWIFAWFGFVPLFFAVRGKSKGRAFLLFYLTGVIFWSGTIYWLIHVTLPGVMLLVLYLALYFGIFGLFFSPLTTHHSPLTTSSTWVILEYIRSHLFTGFPWTLLGYSQFLNLPVIQIADITGAWGVSFMVMMANVVIWELIRGARSKVQGSRCAVFRYSPFVFCFLSILTYGYYKLYQAPSTKHQAPIKVSVIQGNIAQELKWKAGLEEFIINKYLDLTKQAAKDKPDIIIWPEAALPVVLEEEPVYYEKVRDFVKENRIPLLLGTVTLHNGLYYNSALLISEEGKLLDRYDKLRLVPFGEYIPLRKIFGFLETVVPIGDFAAGKEYTLFSLSASAIRQRIVEDGGSAPATRIGGCANICGAKNFGGKRYPLNANFSALICFEDLFPELSREFVKRGADFLVNITNDAWFGRTPCPYQHLQASVFRAVENRIPLMRSANTGISGFIAPTGKIISLVKDRNGRDIFIDGYRNQNVIIPERHLSFYTRYGDIFIAGCFLLVLYGIILELKNQNSKIKITIQSSK